MSSKRILLAICMASFLAANISCSRKVESGYDTIPYVDGVLTDSLSLLERLAASAGQTSGPIVIIGEPEDCWSLCQQFDTSDVFDNIDGHQVRDSLPDFAGERIIALMDYANAPYDSILSGSDGKTALREVAVRNALAAIDTTVGCKVLILSSPLMMEYGSRDVIDLFQQIGCRVPVFCQEDSTVSITKECYTFMRRHNMFKHDICYPSTETLMTVPNYSSTIGFKTIPCEAPAFENPVDTLVAEPTQQTITTD